MTSGDLRLYGWLLASLSTPESVVRELADTAEARTLQRVCEDLRQLAADGKVTSEDDRFVWTETRQPSFADRVADVLRVEPLTFARLRVVMDAGAAELKAVLTSGRFRERSMRWHVGQA